MKSNVCKIENGSKDLEAIFKESEIVAKNNGLTHKQTLQLRLICEEIDGMLPNVVDNFEGKLWFEFDSGVCKVNVSVELEELTSSKKNELISFAKNNKNAAATGVVGKIRSMIENFFLCQDTMEEIALSSGSFHLSTGYSEGVDFPYFWSLNQYRSSIPTEQKNDWDELEKSVIASVADDIIVGVKGKRVDIVIIKKFCGW